MKFQVKPNFSDECLTKKGSSTGLQFGKGVPGNPKSRGIPGNPETRGGTIFFSELSNTQMDGVMRENSG